MSGRTPQPGDRVKVTPNPFEGELKCDGSQGRLIQVVDDGGHVHAFGPGYAAVEVLAPPRCTATEGATGIRCQQPTGHEGGHKGTTTDEQTAVVGYPLFVSWPAEAEPPARPSVRVPNEPHGLPLNVRKKMANHLRDGDLRTAVVVAQNAGLSDMDALAYIRDMPEYQTYLAAHGEKRETCTRDDCPGGPRCSSGATVLHDKTDACGEVV